jgi:CheY-like chemotaxis protein/two-component sensor histidine kinase
MDRQLAHLVRLVDDLLDVNRISRGKMQFKIEPVRLAEVIAQSCESCRPLIDIQGHTLEIDAPDDSLMVKGDAHRLSQVISNLLSNSAKYTDPGGRIRVSLSREGDDAIVCIADNGIGMAPEDLGRVFDMFGQLEPGKSRSQRGLGIGLYLARRIIEMHGGTLIAASPGMGAGSTFTISLPVVSPPPESEPRSATPTTPSIPKLRIVIADDNRDGAESLALLLSLRGHEVVTAKDGLEAVEQVQRWRPDVIILDLGMPGLDGIEAAKRIRMLPGQERVLIAVVTGWGNERARDETRAAGIDVHLVKPVTMDAVDEVLHRYTAT